MPKEKMRKLLAELYQDFWEEEQEKHGYRYNELSFSADSFLRWLGRGKPTTPNTPTP